MVMYEAGMLARSKAGHDKAKMYIIKEVDDTYAVSCTHLTLPTT